MENEESKIIALRNSIQEGLNSTLVEDFDFEENLKRLKAEKRKMAKAIIRQKAINDLNDIWNYTFEKWSAKQAVKYYTTIKLTSNGIEQNHKVGKNMTELVITYLGKNLENIPYFTKLFRVNELT